MADLDNTINNPQDNPQDNPTKDTPQDKPKDNPKDNPTANDLIKLTQEELDKTIQARLERANKQHQKQLEELKEQMKLSTMDDDAKEKYFQSRKDEELEKYKHKLKMYELTEIATSELLQQNIKPTDDIMQIVLSEDAETTKKNIEIFTTLLNDKVNEKVKAISISNPIDDGVATVKTNNHGNSINAMLKDKRKL